jgi:hypothetical protein
MRAFRSAPASLYPGASALSEDQRFPFGTPDDSIHLTTRAWAALEATLADVRAGAKVGQWSGGVVLLRGGVKPSHWLG